MQTGKHLFKCTSCDSKLYEYDYSCQPQERSCPFCNDIGNVMYIGYSGYVCKPQNDMIGFWDGGMQSMVDGKKYDSKSDYYKSVKAAGCEIVGNEKLKNKSETVGDFVTQKEISDTIKQLGG